MSLPPENPYRPAPANQSRVSAQEHLEKVRSVAKAQRMLNIAILMYLMLVVVNIATQFVAANDPDTIVPLLVLPIVLVVVGFIIFAVARMGYAMHGIGHAILYSFAMLIPCLGLILLIILNSRVTDFLTRNGVKVGLMGAEKSTIP